MNLNSQLLFCTKYNISQNELFLMEVILADQENDDCDLVKDYFSAPPSVRGSIRENLISLRDKGIINKTFKIPEGPVQLIPNSYKVDEGKGNAKLYLSEIPFNKIIVRDFHKSSFDMGQELFEAYPISTVVNGLEYKLRRISKKFNSLEDAFRAYGKAIRWKPENHKHVLHLIERGKAGRYNFTTLDDFIVDNDWLNMEALEDKGILSSNHMELL